MSTKNAVRHNSGLKRGLALVLKIVMAAWGAALPSLVLTPGLLAARPRPNRPNIIFIVAEDITTFVGAYGNRELKTPNIDQLAREGVLYRRAYQASGVCAPARAAVITGMYPTSVGTHHMRAGTEEPNPPPGGAEVPQPAEASKNRPAGVPVYSAVLPEYVKPFPEYLRRAGYYAINNQKTDYQFIAPVTTWDEVNASASYRHRPKGKPFFAFYTLFITHESLLALNKAPLTVDPAKVTVPPIYPDTPAVREDIARLYTNIETMDRHLGELVKSLKADNVYDNSYIFFYADNGGSIPWYKREILERGTRVPFIVRLPGGRQAGTTSDELVSGVDLAPTVLSLAGVPIPTHLQGQAFLGPQRAKTPRKYVFGARDRMDTEYDRVRMVRDSRYRYLYNYMPEISYYQEIPFRSNLLPSMKDILKLKEAGKLNTVQAAWFKAKPAEELYDVEQDPYEINNLAVDHPHAAKLEELRGALREWTKKYDGLGGVPEKEMLRRMWNGGDSPPQTVVPEVIRVGGGVRLDCATGGASIGYYVIREGESPGQTTHRVQSWDGEVVVLGSAKPGDARLAPPSWQVYDGGVIRLKRGDRLHVNAKRIGYQPAVIEYTDGKVVVKKTEPPAGR